MTVLESKLWIEDLSMFRTDVSVHVIQLESITNLFHVSLLSLFAAIEGLISKTLGNILVGFCGGNDQI